MKKLGILFITILLSLLVVVPAYGQSTLAESKAKILVLPFYNRDNNQNLGYLTTSIMDSINSVLVRVEIMHLLYYKDYLNQIQDKGIRIDQALSNDSLNQIGEITGAEYIIKGMFYGSSGNNIIEAVVYNISNKETMLSYQERAEDAYAILDIIDVISAGLVANLSVFIKQDPYYQYNRTPTFFWRDVSGATRYELYVDSQLVYSGLSTEYKMEEALNFGEHSFYTITYVGGRSIQTENFKFNLLELTTPEILSDPRSAPYDEYPEVIIEQQEGVEHYQVIIDDQQKYDGTENTIKLSQKMNFGEYQLKIVCYNPYQSVESEIIEFEIKELFPSILLEPANDTNLFTDTAPIIRYIWDNDCKVAAHQVMVNGEKIGESEVLSYETEAPPEGEYSWYIITKAGSQETISETHTFTYKTPMFKFGIRQADSLTLQSDIDNSYIALFNVGVAAEYIPFRYMSIESGIMGGVYTMRFNSERYSFQADESRLNYIYFSIPVFVKGRYNIGLWQLSLPLGVSFDFAASGMLSVGGNKYLLENLRTVYIVPMVGFEAGYIFSDWFEFHLGVRYELGLFPLTEEDFFHQSQDHRIGITFGFNIYKI